MRVGRLVEEEPRVGEVRPVVEEVWVREVLQAVRVVPGELQGVPEGLEVQLGAREVVERAGLLVQTSASVSLLLQPFQLQRAQQLASLLPPLAGFSLPPVSSPPLPVASAPLPHA